MKSTLYVLAGIVVGLFIYFSYLQIRQTFFIKDEKIDADDFFSEYLNDKIQQKQNLIEQVNTLQDYIQTLNDCKFNVDSLQLRKVVGDKPEVIYNELRASSDEFYTFHRRIRSLLFSDSTTNRYVSKAAASINNSITNEFSLYEEFRPLLSAADYKQFVDNYNNEKNFINHKKIVSNLIFHQVSILNNVVAASNSQSDTLNRKIARVKGSQKIVTENSRDKLLITMVIPIFAFILAMIIFVPYFLRNQEIMFNKLLDDKILIQVFTVFILVISILLLGIGDKLSGETLGTLLGGISVYVLQRSLDNRPSS